MTGGSREGARQANLRKDSDDPPETNEVRRGPKMSPRAGAVWRGL